MLKKNANLVSKQLLAWYKNNRRKYPWRVTKNPYRIFIAESLLQKTNVEKVYPAYLTLIRKYPQVSNLASAKLSDLKKIIAPLGLIKRAKFLKEGAKKVTRDFKGRFPADKRELKKIIGIGDYMAHAILCYVHDKPLPLVDTNVARVYGRIYKYRSTKLPYADRKLWDLSSGLLPSVNYKEYNLAILDLSALICLPRKPKCRTCPCSKYCSSCIIKVKLQKN